jgi:DNA invertase Pin-like site-specific DNA recombinase
MTRCAIYTRKSHEEGLDQDFNSLDAQRDAALSYIQSQKHEGWSIVDAEYNDGGYSGGHLNRPALQKLIADIKRRKIDIIVVYKIDRLTRSLTDFAKLIDIFDEYDVTFVSVTQSFNTTTSMGRLTLNVLLSFAQFEREITGERIRDKIASSVQKGIWMGGMIPLGYDVKDRKLLVNEIEAHNVRLIFTEYLKNPSIFKLLDLLHDEGITNKSWQTQKGTFRQGKPFSRSTIYTLLRNPIYIGKIKHRSEIYDGNHAAIIEQELWNAVQAKLNNQAGYKTSETKTYYMLRGKIFNPKQNLYETTYSSKKLKDGVRKTRYYVLRGSKKSFSGEPVRLNADKIEAAILSFTSEIIDQHVNVIIKRSAVETFLKVALKRVEISKNTLSVILDTKILRCFITDINLNRIEIAERNASYNIFQNIEVTEKEGETQCVCRVQYKNYTGQYYITDKRGLASTPETAQKNQNLIQAVVYATKGFRTLQSGQYHSISELAKHMGCDRSYMSKILKCVFLSPKIKEAILDGFQPANMTVQKLIKISEHAAWDVQERKFGIRA